MPNLTSVTVTSGVPTAGSGTVSTIDALMADGGQATLGTTTGTKVTTDAAGTIQQYLRGLVTLLGGTGTLGSVSQGYSSKVSVTRPANTTAYGANDVLGPASGTSAIAFTSIGPGAGEILITGVSLERDVAAVISGEFNYILHLYNVTPPSALADNAAFDLPSGDRASYLGSINVGVPVDLGATLYIGTDGVNKQVTLASSTIYGYLVTVGAYTPASGTALSVTLHSVAV